MAEEKKTYGSAISGPPGAGLAAEMPPYSFSQCVDEIEGVINSLSESDLEGKTLAIGKLRGAIVKLQLGGN